MAFFTLNYTSVTVARTRCYRTLVSRRILPRSPQNAQLTLSYGTGARTVGLSPLYVASLDTVDVVLGLDLQPVLGDVYESLPFCEGHGP